MFGTSTVTLQGEAVTLWGWVGYSTLKRFFNHTLSFPTPCAKTRKH